MISCYKWGFQSDDEATNWRNEKPENWDEKEVRAAASSCTFYQHYCDVTQKFILIHSSNRRTTERLSKLDQLFGSKVFISLSFLVCFCFYLALIKKVNPLKQHLRNLPPLRLFTSKVFETQPLFVSIRFLFVRLLDFCLQASIKFHYMTFLRNDSLIPTLIRSLLNLLDEGGCFYRRIGEGFSLCGIWWNKLLQIEKPNYFHRRPIGINSMFLQQQILLLFLLTAFSLL